MISSPPVEAAVRVLIAEDDSATLAVVTEQLTVAGHQVVAQASTRQAAVEQALACTPDVVLLDHHLPDGRGVEAAREIVAARPTTAVVFLTGDPDAVLDDAELAGTGAVAFLSKPTTRHQLDTTVRLAAARARELSLTRADAASAQRQLADRKLIERAKGILMRRTGSSEQEAYRILQRSSQDRATPMVRIAQAVLDSEPGANQIKS